MIYLKTICLLNDRRQPIHLTWQFFFTQMQKKYQRQLMRIFNLNQTMALLHISSRQTTRSNYVCVRARIGSRKMCF